MCEIKTLIPLLISKALRHFKARPLPFILFLAVTYASLINFSLLKNNYLLNKFPLLSVIYEDVLTSMPTSEVRFPVKQNLIVTGTISDKKLNEEGNLKTLYLKDAGIVCYVNKLNLSDPDYPIGAVITVEGQFSTFEPATNPGQFDSKNYNLARGYCCYVNSPVISVKSLPGFSLREVLFRVRTDICKRILAYCPIEGGTINTLLFGDKSGIDEDRSSLYKLSGLSHFLVISGLHIFVAGGGIYSLFKNLGMKRRYAAVFSLIFVISYGALVGFTVSILRAVIMFCLRLIADMINRTYDILSAVSLAGTVTLFSNPLWLCDSAFLYSYCAVISVALFYTFLMREREHEVYKRVFTKRGIKPRIAKFRMNSSVPVMIYLFMLPVTLNFQCFSNILSIPLNLIIGLLSAPILYCGALCFLFSSLGLSFLCKLFDFFCAIMLKLIDLLSVPVSKSWWAMFHYKPSAVQIVIYYIIFILVVFICKRKLSTNVKLCALLPSVIFLSKSLWYVPSVAMLDVGQGDCIVMTTSPHSAIICDAGSSSQSDIGKYILLPYLHARGIRVIEDIYLTHSDNDHINGVEYLLENGPREGIRINRIILPATPDAYIGASEVINYNYSADRNSDFSSDYGTIISSAISKNIEIAFISKDASLSYGGSRKRIVNITCLWPDTQHLSGDSNDDSMVLWYSCGLVDMLLSGDATTKTEQQLDLSSPYIKTMDKQIDIYKCAHHGSDTSSGEQFIKAIKPKITIISVGRNNRYGHPKYEVIKRLEEEKSLIRRTDKEGIIELKLLKP